MAYQSNKWHTDMTYTPDPPLGCVLYGKHVPPAGGDTMFLNLYRAFDTLSPAMQEFASTLTAIHDITASMPADFMAQSWAPKQLESLHKKTPPVEHPVVRTHPETGKKVIFVNSLFTTHIESLRPAESDALLQMLYTHITTVEYTCRFQWQPNSIAIWDNRSTQHKPVNDYFPAHRRLERITIDGDRPY